MGRQNIQDSVPENTDSLKCQETCAQKQGAYEVIMDG